MLNESNPLVLQRCPAGAQLQEQTAQSQPSRPPTAGAGAEGQDGGQRPR